MVKINLMEGNGELKLRAVLHDGELGFFRLKLRNRIEGRVYYVPLDFNPESDKIYMKIYEEFSEVDGRIVTGKLSEHLDDVVVARRALIR